MPSYLTYFPKPLLKDFLDGRWLPIVGAGMSRNAITPPPNRMPLWDDLGRALAQDMPNYPYTTPLDAISAYAHEFGDLKLVERVGEALLISQAEPGDAHRAFCSLPFTIVCTTNVDFLLEKGYAALSHPHRPIVDEEQLAIRDVAPTTSLLKLHGDLYHPARVVLTEEAYDGFLTRHPLLATYLASLLITRTAVLIGYSLDDPDFRQVWQLIGDRLGSSRNYAYALTVGATGSEIARFDRRGVKVINFPGQRSHYGTILTEVFNELSEYSQLNFIGESHVMREEPLTQLSLPRQTTTRLCYFSLPLGLISQYQATVFPLAERAGLVPVTSTDVVSPNDTLLAKINVLLRRSSAALFDVASEYSRTELALATRLNIPLLVISESTLASSDHMQVLYRTASPIGDQIELLHSLEEWFSGIAGRNERALADEPARLLSHKEYRAAVISAIAYLESWLRRTVHDFKLPDRVYSLRSLTDIAVSNEILSPEDQLHIREYSTIRNDVIHLQKRISRDTATRIVEGVLSIVNKRF